eukprot:6254566-Alexandrium_andersonii.AAC.1
MSSAQACPVETAPGKLARMRMPTGPRASVFGRLKPRLPPYSAPPGPPPTSVLFAPSLFLLLFLLLGCSGNKTSLANVDPGG